MAYSRSSENLHTIASFKASLTVISLGAHACDEEAKVLHREIADAGVGRNAGRSADEDCRDAERRRDAGRSILAMAIDSRVEVSRVSR